MFSFTNKHEFDSKNTCRFCLDTLYNKQSFHVTQDIQDSFENLTKIKLKLSLLLSNKVCRNCILEISRCSTAKNKFTKNQEWLQDTFLQFTEEQDLQNNIKTESKTQEIIQMNTEVLDSTQEFTELQGDIVKSEYQIMSYELSLNSENYNNEKATSSFDDESFEHLTKIQLDNKSKACEKERTRKSTRAIKRLPKTSCPHCGKLVVKVQLQSHVDRIHLKAYRFFCDLCPFKNYTKEKFIDHMRTHLNRKDIKCTMCDRMFNCKSSMTSHRDIVHLKKYQITCEICQKTFGATGVYNYHMRSKHTTELPFVCNVAGCTKAYSTQSDLANHKKLSHSKPVTCNVCSKTFNSQLALKLHLRRHNPNLKCSKCDRKFPCNYSLNQHFKTHDGIRNFSCSQCEKKFYTRSALNHHVQSVHISYCCSIPGCGAFAKGKQGMRSHVTKIHKDIGEKQLKEMLENNKNVTNPSPEVVEIQMPQSSSFPPVPPLIYYI